MKNRVLAVVAPDLPALPANPVHHSPVANKNLPEKFTYARPGKETTYKFVQTVNMVVQFQLTRKIKILPILLYIERQGN